MAARATSVTKYEVEKFNSRNYFNLWRAGLVGSGLLKALEGREKLAETLSEDDANDRAGTQCNSTVFVR